MRPAPPAKAAPRRLGTEPRFHPIQAFLITRGLCSALGLHLRANGLNHALPAKVRDERRIRRLVDERAYSRQGASALNPGTPYPMHVPNEIRLAGV